MKISRSMLAGASLLALSCISAIGSAGHRCSRFARCHHHHRREATSAAPIRAFGGVIKEKASEFDGLVGAARRAAEGRAQRIAHHDGRPGLRCTEHLRRRHSHACHGSHRRAGAALHQFPFYLALLTDAGGAYHRPQSSFGGLRSGRRNINGIPGLQFHHPDREGHHRHDPEGERVRDLVVRQGPQHTLVPVEPGRALQSMAQRHGI